MDKLLRELLGVNGSQAFGFFLSGLSEVTHRDPYDEMSYVASILNRYARIPLQPEVGVSSAGFLARVFDQFLFKPVADPELLETGGSQVILFAGFFRDQMRRRHNVEWYDEIGCTCYYKASLCTDQAGKRELFGKLSQTLPYWTFYCQKLSRICRDNRFLLKPN